METYQALREISATWGSILFGVMFVGVLTYALWPSNHKKFDEAAQIPLLED